MSAVSTPKRVSEVFLQRFGHPCTGIARAPGRVNLLGEHVDYNDGFVLPAAMDRATYVAFAASGHTESRLWAEDYQRETGFSEATLQGKTDLRGEALEDWAKYPAGVVWSWLEGGYVAPGLDAVYASDVPRGAGLSSSASVELAIAVALEEISGASLAPMDMALLCQRAENVYVGVNCGIMDQAASACSQPGQIMVLDCRSLEYENLPLPGGVLIVVADTGVRHTLAGSAYNDRRSACERAVEALKLELPDIRALRDVTPEDFDRLAPTLPPEIEMRARHVVEEIERTRRAVTLLKAGNVQAFGHLMNACHASLRDLYEVSCPELDTMTDIAQSLPGCHGSRLTGAGFGGCTVNLVDADRAEAFAEELTSGYQQATGRRAEIYMCRASGGAGILR